MKPNEKKTRHKQKTVAEREREIPLNARDFGSFASV